MRPPIQIGNVTLDFIAQISPDKGTDGRPRECAPATRYVNARNLPLNKYGEGPFCRFKITSDGQDLDVLGVYALVDGSNEVLYIGKCTGRTSTLGKRFNMGYGLISPRNCYQRGQSTNCRINGLILKASKAGRDLSLFFHRTQDGQSASDLECKFMQTLKKPPWNLKWNANPTSPQAQFKSS